MICVDTPEQDMVTTECTPQQQQNLNPTFPTQKEGYDEGTADTL